MWNAEFDNGLKCWAVEDSEGYPLLEGKWEGRLCVKNESNARLIAAVLNADDENRLYTVKAADKAADFGLSPLLSGIRNGEFRFKGLDPEGRVYDWSTCCNLTKQEL